MARVAVTGAAGFIGAYLSRALAAEGHEVLALDNYARGRPARLEQALENLHALTCDVRDEQALAQHFAGLDAVFHLAAINGTENFYKRPQLVLDVGVRGALAVAGACNTGGVKALIVASSAEVYQTPAIVPTDESVPLVLPDSLNPRYSYGGSKIVSELIAFNYCRDTVPNVQCFLAAQCLWRGYGLEACHPAADRQDRGCAGRWQRRGPAAGRRQRNPRFLPCR